MLRWVEDGEVVRDEVVNSNALACIEEDACCVLAYLSEHNASQYCAASGTAPYPWLLRRLVGKWFRMHVTKSHLIQRNGTEFSLSLSGCFCTGTEREHKRERECLTVRKCLRIFGQPPTAPLVYVGMYIRANLKVRSGGDGNILKPHPYMWEYLHITFTYARHSWHICSTQNGHQVDECVSVVLLVSRERTRDARN